ncbi:LacI family DNA-binding transcriptional regulator [Hoyosella subflava]|uniref:Putative LacI-family transcriptional regulator n=1 Tax=Hoyosella subflava (strain DSM 45089 / JCM 17490 / NBRC 109087 / DQS3-9A1) TaxID=443218 RepID=F6EH38_HOYSD|nr:LacI family DNA-binding transcriptional regulator [Hoyosella subflava]AEF39875.1 Putative LacI-family transcriptional regulator [Hoyosella subflava DQS3-9A1]
MRPRATSVDVAREAGVSRATVSYVLNDAPGQSIPEETRQRVLIAARKLGYSPSAAARTLRRGRSDVVLFVLPEWPIGPVIGTLISTLTAELAAHRLTLLTYQKLPGSTPFRELWTAIAPAAIIVCEALSDAELETIRTAGIEVLTALAPDPAVQGSLAVAQELFGWRQVQHLTERGHVRLAYAYPADERLESFAAPRLRGARRACSELGLTAPVVATIEDDNAAHVISQWRALDEPVTALCGYNDEIAFALLDGARRNGLRVPADLAVIGVDDIPVARYANPPLTTVATGVEVQSRAIAASVLGILADRPARSPLPHQNDIVRVIERDST